MIPVSQPYDCYCIVDFEATCDNNIDFLSFPHEIIEFPVLVVNVASLQVEHTFHSFVRPTESPTLSEFCMRLTGIKQSQVDAAPTLVDVLKRMFLWLKEIGIFEKRFIFVSHGPCDFGKFLCQQCERTGFHLPRYLRQWIDIKRTFREFHGWSSNTPCGIKDLLGYYKQDFQGNEHSGLEDAKNLSRIIIKMIEEGIQLHPNDYMIPKNSPRNSPLLSKNSPKHPKSPSMTKSAVNSITLDEKKVTEPRLLESWLIHSGSPIPSPFSRKKFSPSKKRATYDNCQLTTIEHSQTMYFQSF